MSTATAFKYHRPFPFCPGSSYPGSMDYIELTLAQAMSFYWNLENLSFTTTGNATSAPYTYDIAWTMTLGATEALDADCDGSQSLTRAGAYYNGSTPANAPRNRVCNTAAPKIISFLASKITGTFERKRFFFEVGFYSSPTPGNVRLYYAFYMLSGSGSNPDTLLSTGVIITNPANNSFSGTIPQSGTFTILGHSFSWVGGVYSSGAWGPNIAGCSISATSSAFTY